MYENSVNDMPAPEPRLDRILGEHVRHGEVLADVAQEVEQLPNFGQPLAVVDHLRLVGRRARSR